MKRKGKTGPKPENGVGRTRLMGCGPVVSRATNDALKLWRDVHGVPLGRAIDAMLDFVKENPSFRIPKRGIMSRRQIDREIINQHTGEKTNEGS